MQAKLARDGRNIALCYRLMIEAGLRVNEARSLRWSDIDLENDTLHLRAEVTKNSNAATLPLTTGLKEALTAWQKETKGKENVPVVKITDRLLHIFNDDLVAIGLATYDEKDKKKVIKKDASGRTLDLHALRHTFGTRLGATPNNQNAQSEMERAR